MSKLLSIIIVTYNAEKFIRNAIESILANNSNDYELIIIDGASTDSTISILNEYKLHITHLISEKDNGIYDAMNKGIGFATGDYIYFLGADDIWCGDINLLKKTLIDNSKIYYGNVKLYPTNKIYDGKFNLFKFMNRNICHQSIFYPRSVFENLNFKVEYKLMADFILNIELWNSDKFKFNYIPQTIAIYNVEGASTMNVDNFFQKNAFQIIYRNFGILGVFYKLLNPIRNLFYNKYED